MEVSAALYLGFLALVAAGRLLELRVSHARQRRMLAQGARRIPEPNYFWMVALHSGTLAASAAEVLLAQRPFIPLLGGVTLALWILSNAARYWVIQTLAGHWNVNIVDSSPLGVVSSGPYRYIRHPNYVAVFIEILSIPLIHTAWITALAATLAHVFVLRGRVAREDAVLLANPEYRRAMGTKPRFIPFTRI